MAAFQKIFSAIDKDNTGAITSTDLRNYMQKMKYKESFVTTWTSLFDPEHTGIITYEKYCQVLGLNSAEYRPSTETGSNIQQPETETRSTNIELVQTEVTQEKQEEQQSSSRSRMDPRRRRNIGSVGQEEANSKDPLAQKEPSKKFAKSLNANESKHPKEDINKSQSRKRKHTESNPKDDPSASAYTRPDSEAVPRSRDQQEPWDSGTNEFDMPMESKSWPMERMDAFGEIDTVAPQKAEQCTREKPRSKPVKSEDEKSERKAKYDEKSGIREGSGKSEKNSLKQESECAEVHKDDGIDVFDLLISAKSQPIQAIFTEEGDHSKVPINTATPKSTENVSAANPDSSAKAEVETSDEVKTKNTDKKRKRKASEKIKKEPTHRTADQPRDSGKDVTESPMDNKTRSLETADRFEEESLETIVSGTTDLTLAEETTSLQESTMEPNKSIAENPQKNSENLTRKASEGTEKESLIAENNESTKNDQEDLEAGIFKNKDHPMEIVDEDDRKAGLVIDSDKPKWSGAVADSPPNNVEKRKNPKALEKLKTGESDAKHQGKQGRNIPESGNPSKQQSEYVAAPSDELVQQSVTNPGEHDKGQKLEKRISESLEAEEKKDRSPVAIPPEESAQVETPGKKRERKKQKRDKKAFESTERKEVAPPIKTSKNNSGFQGKPHQEGQKRGKKISDSSNHGPKESSSHREKKPYESLKMDVDIESSLPAAVLDLATELNPPASSKRSKNPSESSDTLQEQKKTSLDPKNKWQETPPDSKSSHSRKSSLASQKNLEHYDVEMTPVQEVAAQSVEETVNTNQLQLSKRPQMEIVPTPMEIEIIPVVSEPQDSTKASDTPVDTSNVTIPDQKGPKKRSPDSGKKRKRRASESSPVGGEKPVKTGFNTDQKAVGSGKKSSSSMKRQELPKDENKATDKKINRTKKPSETSSGDKDSIPPVESDIVLSVSTNQESALLPAEIGPDSTKTEIVEALLPPVEHTKPPKSDSKKKLGNKPAHSFPSETDGIIVSEKGSEHELAEHQLGKPENLRSYQKGESSESAQTEEVEIKPPPLEEVSTSELESSVTQLEQQQSTEFPTTQKPSESSFGKADILEPARNKKNKRPKKTSKFAKNCDLKAPESSSQKPIEVPIAPEASNIQESNSHVDESQKHLTQTSDTKEDQPKVSKKPISQPSKDFAKQPEKNDAGRKGTTKRIPAKPVKKISVKIKATPIMELKDTGLEELNQPPLESGSSEKNDNNDSKKSTQKKRKGTSRQGGGSDKRSKKDVKKLTQKSEREEKRVRRRKRPQPTEKEGEIAIKKSIKRPRIGNLECGRFPKAFAVQVPHKVNQHRRDGAPVSTHALGKPPKGFTTKMSIERRNRNKPNKAIQRWKLRKSLRAVGTIVILLAGRHKGKRAVVIGRHKFSGLLLVTGPFKLNGVPIRRVHPDYVIATKTVIKMDKIRLPGRMQTRQYFARQKPDSKSKTMTENLFIENSANKKAYVLRDERKTDQKLIDKRVLAAIRQDKNAKMLFAYLRSLFSLSRTDKPHTMVF